MLRSYASHADGRLDTQLPVEQLRTVLTEPGTLVWVDIEDPEDADIECLLGTFELHPLTVEDCIMPNVRPKLSEFDRYLFIVLQGMQRNDTGKLAPVELDCIMGDNFLITVRSQPIKTLDEERARVEKRSPIIQRGADFLLYSLVDALIDSYFPVIDEVEAKVDDLQTRLLTASTEAVLSELFVVYNELVMLRRTLAPHREILTRLNRGDLALIKPHNAVYFRDIYDHLLRMSDLVDGCREVTTMALEGHATIVSNRLNEIMKTMTAMATLSVPLVIITGVFGMNFGEHPELGSRAIYHWLSLAMLAMIPVMFFYFRKFRWL